MAQYFITGANRGIGLELVRQVLARGHNVYAACRNPDGERALWEIGTDYPKSLTLVRFDVGQDGEDDLANTVPRDETIDVLVNNAGILAEHSLGIESLDLKLIEKSFQVNSIGPMRVIRKLLPMLKRSSHGRIVQVTSLMGSLGDNKSGYAYGYRMSKAALNMLNVSLAIEFPNITCVALHPGWVKTDMGGSAAPLSVHDSVEGLVDVIGGLTRGDSGKFLDYRGRVLPF